MNATVGDLDGNAAIITSLIRQSRSAGADLVVFPELALTGYPPEDLLLKTHFLDATFDRLNELAAEAEGIVCLVGFPELADDVYNAAALLADGKVVAIYRKMMLPNYGVFDEHRYFQSGTTPSLFELNGVDVGVTICEDIWEPGPPATTLALSGAQLIVNLSASPYHAAKGISRERMLVQRARDSSVCVVFCNLVGGQDELVFDGHSLAIDQDGSIISRLPQFEECLGLCTIDTGPVVAKRLQDPRHRAELKRQRQLQQDEPSKLASLNVESDKPNEAHTEHSRLLGAEEEVYRALVTGLADYVNKNGFKRVVLGLSGGIDSALAACIAADALGSDRLSCVVMPSRYSSQDTQTDARTIAKNLDADLVDIPIDVAMGAYDSMLADTFADVDPDITEENIQARIRGNIVMAISNKFGWLVLATGNKSELSVGYATLYGDMAGGFAVLKDVFKGWVYRLARWRNEQADTEVIPASVLDRPPSAELRYEQRDEESLPPYELLDQILASYVEADRDARQLVQQGLPSEAVEEVVRLVDRAEYKRRQAPPGIRISIKAFGRDRRLPITNRFWY
jgi:NAD+ synthase (glutamine-hydrolysing)